MNPPPAVPLKALLVLGALVLAAHWWALRAYPQRVQASDRPGPFVVRTIAPPGESAPVLRPERLRMPVEAVPPPPAAQAPARSASRRPPQEAVTVARRTVPDSNPDAPPAASGPLNRISVPPPVRLHYQVTALLRDRQFEARSELRWRHDGESYEAELEVGALLQPARRQRSAGRISADGIEPLRFSDKARTEEAAHFERDKGKVSFSSNRPDAPLAAGAQDRLSVLLQLGAMIAGNPQRFPPSTTISVQTAGTREAEAWLFTVEGVEELRLPGGVVKALKLTRTPKREFDQKVELWLAPGMDYVPVRLRLTQPNGDSVDQQWSSTDRG